jgi:hypothetical protein
MTTLALDTYALVTKLKESGVPEQQAAAQVETITKAIDSALGQARHDYQLDDLATKRDLKELEVKLESRIKETELKIELVRSELKRDLAETKAELVRWVVGVGLLQTVLITALVLKLAGSF